MSNQELIIEGCKEMIAEDIRIMKERERTDAVLDWE